MEWIAENGLGGDEMNNHHDYDFTAENLNKQLTDEHYDPETVEGEYIMTISNSQGWQLKKRITLAGGQFVPSTAVFNVP